MKKFTYFHVQIGKFEENVIKGKLVSKFLCVIYVCMNQIHHEILSQTLNTYETLGMYQVILDCE